MTRLLLALATGAVLALAAGCGPSPGPLPVDASIEHADARDASLDALDDLAPDVRADGARDAVAERPMDVVDAADAATLDAVDALDLDTAEALDLDTAEALEFDAGPPPPTECPPADYDAAEPATGPRLSADLQPIFDAHCNCHQRGQAPDLRPGRAYASLYCARLAVPCPTTPWRAVPGDPEHSGLYVRVRGTGCFEQMPLGLPALAPEDIDTIRAWLAAGAAP